jgi:hypothetical protein
MRSGSISRCCFPSPISPSRLCCGCLSDAGATGSPKTSSCSCCDINSPYSDGMKSAPDEPHAAPAQVHRGDQSETRLELRVCKFERSSADGAFMEPRGCKRWQSSANRGVAEAAETSKNRCDRLPPVAYREGVNGPSPSEGHPEPRTPGPCRSRLKCTSSHLTHDWRAEATGGSGRRCRGRSLL